MNNKSVKYGHKAPVWIKDEETDTCMSCSYVFNLTNRRHHCRACGKIFCNSCSNRCAYVEYLRKRARVCLFCFKLLFKSVKDSNKNLQVNSNFLMDSRKKYILPPIIVYKKDENINMKKITNNLPLHVILQSIKDENCSSVSFVINANLAIIVKALFIPEVGRICWFYKSQGMRSVGMDEIIFGVESQSTEDTLPLFPFHFFQRIYKEASFGERFNHMSYFVLDSSQPLALFFIQYNSNDLNLKGFSLPELPFLIATLVIGPEVGWAKLMPSRLALRLSVFTPYFPIPLITFLKRDPVFSEIDMQLKLMNNILQEDCLCLLPIAGLTVSLELQSGYSSNSCSKNISENVFKSKKIFDYKNIELNNSNISNNINNFEFNKIILPNCKFSKILSSQSINNEVYNGHDQLRNEDYKNKNLIKPLSILSDNNITDKKFNNTNIFTNSYDSTHNYFENFANNSAFIGSLLNDLVDDISHKAIFDELNSMESNNKNVLLTYNDSSLSNSTDFINSFRDFENHIEFINDQKLGTNMEQNLFFSQNNKENLSIASEGLHVPITPFVNYFVNKFSDSSQYLTLSEKIKHIGEDICNNDDIGCLINDKDDNHKKSISLENIDNFPKYNYNQIKRNNLNKYFKIILTIPCIKYKQVMKILQSTDDVLTLMSSYNLKSNFHLVCFQDAKSRDINVQVHGVDKNNSTLSTSFIQFKLNESKEHTGSSASSISAKNTYLNIDKNYKLKLKSNYIDLKSAPTLTENIAKNILESLPSSLDTSTSNILSSSTYWSIEEDGVIIYASSYHMMQIKESLLNMTNDEIICDNGDVISIIWSEETDNSFSGNLVSSIDDTNLTNIDFFRPKVNFSEEGVRFVERESQEFYDCTKLTKKNSYIRCTDVFFLSLDESNFSERLTSMGHLFKNINNLITNILMKFLSKFLDNNIYKLSVRISISNAKIDILTGSDKGALECEEKLKDEIQTFLMKLISEEEETTNLKLELIYRLLDINALLYHCPAILIN